MRAAQSIADCDVLPNSPCDSAYVAAEHALSTHRHEGYSQHGQSHSSAVCRTQNRPSVSIVCVYLLAMAAALLAALLFAFWSSLAPLEAGHPKVGTCAHASVGSAVSHTRASLRRRYAAHMRPTRSLRDLRANACGWRVRVWSRARLVACRSGRVQVWSRAGLVACGSGRNLLVGCHLAWLAARRSLRGVARGAVAFCGVDGLVEVSCVCTDPAEWAGGLGRRSGGARAVGLCGRSHAWGPWAWAVRRDERTQAGVVLRAGSRRAGRRLASCWAQASVVLGACIWYVYVALGGGVARRTRIAGRRHLAWDVLAVLVDGLMRPAREVVELGDVVCAPLDDVGFPPDTVGHVPHVSRDPGRDDGASRLRARSEGGLLPQARVVGRARPRAARLVHIRPHALGREARRLGISGLRRHEIGRAALLHAAKATDEMADVVGGRRPLGVGRGRGGDRLPRPRRGGQMRFPSIRVAARCGRRRPRRW